MTDAEIIRAVAEEVMGWREGYISTSLGHVPDSASWHNDDWSFSILKSVWDPLHNANHTLLVIERMRELGWYFTCEYFTTGLIEAGFIYKKTLPNRPQKVIEYHISFGTAVCLAALKALEGEK